MASLLIASALIAPAPAGAAGAPRTVVLLVFDGWAPSTIETNPPPALARIQSEGAFTHHLIPEYPSTDSVSLFSLSTGCRPSTHGIVGDEFIDPDRGLYNGSLDSSWMTECEHLHTAAERQGLRVATWNWFDAKEHTDPEAQVAALLRALQLSDTDRPRLLIAHFADPQATAESAGLESPEIKKAVVEADAIVARVMSAIKAMPEQSVTLIVASDHGLLPVWTEVNVAGILDGAGVDGVEFAAAGATGFIYVKPEQLQAVIRALSVYQRQIQVHLSDSVPREWHLSRSKRVGDILLAANPPYILESPRRWPAGTSWLAPWLPDMIWARTVVKAMSGYPGSVRGMPGLLYVWGSGINRAGRITRLNAIDLHPTICRLLGIQPGEVIDGEPMAPIIAAD